MKHFTIYSVIIRHDSLSMLSQSLSDKIVEEVIIFIDSSASSTTIPKGYKETRNRLLFITEKEIQ